VTVLAAPGRPRALRAHSPEHYSFYRLAEGDAGETGAGGAFEYGVAAVGEHPDALELHLTLSAFSPRVLRLLRADLRWLEAHARERGKARILGATALPNAQLSRFAELFGFSACREHLGADGRTYQLTTREVPDAAPDDADTRNERPGPDETAERDERAGKREKPDGSGACENPRARRAPNRPAS
jgi:hypothetical protein